MKLLSRWFRRSALEREMREEMEGHIEARASALVERGMTREEAERTARIEFGSMEAHLEESRAARGYRFWDELRSDLRFAFRTLRRQPGYAAAAVTILALTIGVNGAFFSLLFHHVLKPLPIRGAERHFELSGRDRTGRSTGGWSASEIEALAESAKGWVEDFYTSRTIQTLVLEPTQRLGVVSFVSDHYFHLLGGNAAVGRALSEGEQREAVAVLSRSGQRRLFPNDPAPLGKTLRVRNTVLTVIGVMPEEFTGADLALPDFWTGSGMSAAMLGESEDTEPRYSLAGLLAPDVPLAQAAVALTTTAKQFTRAAGEPVDRVELTARSGYLPTDAGSMTVAGLTFAAFLAVFLIACANLANLCLSRAASRTHEIGMRRSLGASRSRIVRQLLTESLCVALLGAAGGLAVAAIAMQKAQAYLATVAGNMGVTLVPAEMDWRTVLFAAALGIAAGVAFGLLPAIEASASSLVLSTKRDGSSFAGRVRPRRMRGVLIAGQTASSLTLLVLGGVFIRHIQSLDARSPGYDLDKVSDLRLESPQETLLTEIGAHPSVATVSAVETVPLYGRLPRRSATAGGQVLPMAYNHVDPRFFEVLGLAVEGRNFTYRESETKAKVAVISQGSARAFWPDASPLGQTITVEEPQATTYEVIGVVPDVILGGSIGNDAMVAYFPAAAGQEGIRNAVVRIEGSPSVATAAIRELCANVGERVGCQPVSLREVWGLQRLPFRIAAAVAGALGALGLALTAIGLHSVTSYSVVHRRREIGVHLAVGGTPAQVTRRIVQEAWKTVAVGLAVGLPVCLVLSRLISASTLGIDGYDPSAYAGVTGLLALITTAACAVPARKAAGLDPVTSLKAD